MTTVELWNTALAMLNLPQMHTLDDEGATPSAIRSIYPALRDRALAEHTWGFAIRSSKLKRLEGRTSPDPAYPMVYQLPNDIIRIMQVQPNDPRYMRTGSEIYLPTGNDDAYLEYVARVDTGDFSVPFCMALAYYLASELAMSIAHDMSQVQWFRKQYEAEICQAKAIDSQENIAIYQRQPMRSSWIASRFGGEF